MIENVVVDLCYVGQVLIRVDVFGVEEQCVFYWVVLGVGIGDFGDCYGFFLIV